MASSENELPGLTTEDSAQSSSGNMTDSDTQDHKSNNFAFMDQAFFYNLDQLAPDNPLFFMQQQQQQHGFDGQFITKDNENRSVATSLANSLESLRSAVAANTTEGEQPLSFWSGLNNFLSNVTHNNLFPAFPNIARSFSEYLANHPVPFLSSFNPPTAEPIASSSSSSSKMVDPFKPPFEVGNTGMQIRVLGVPQTGAKSRVETQIKLCIQLVTDGGDKALWWSHLKLPDNMVTKDRQKKLGNATGAVDLEKTLYLQAKVLCASDPTRKVTTCMGCIQRERKRSQRRKENKMTSETDDDNRTVADDEQQSLIADEERILLFNCSDIVDFSAGDTILPTRITCYCRHHSEKVGFCIYFEMVDYTGKKVAGGISPPIMITDDHKSNKLKSGQKRRRTDSEVNVPITASNWMKSLPFGIGSSSSASSPGPIEENKQGFPYFPFASSSAAASLSSLSSRIIPSSTPSTAPSTPLLLAPDQSNMSYAQLQQPVYARPKLNRLIPTQAPISGGIEVTILGTDFRPGMTVMFGDMPAKDVQYWSPNTLICTLPAVSNPGAVVVSIRDQPRVKEDLCIFTYLAETDRALMELALQVVGMKTTGVVEDARKIAMRIVQGNGALDNVKKE